MKSAILRTFSTVAAALASAVPVVASDQIVSIPDGWRIGHAAPACTAGTVAVILWPQESHPFESSSRVMIVKRTGTTFVEFSGKAAWLKLSPSGAHLLVHLEGPDGPRASLVATSTGEILWTKSPDRRNFRFSVSGQSIYAFPRRSEWGPAGDTVEVLGLDGLTRRMIRLETGFTDVLIPDDGSTAIVALSKTIMSIRFGESIVTEWTRDFPYPEEPFVDLRPLGEGRIALRQELGYWKAVESDGTIRYSFDPVTLDRQDPARSLIDYSNYDPVAVPMPDRVLLFNGTTDALLLDLTNGAWTGVSLNLAVPTGFQRVGAIEDSKIVFASPSAILIRTISF
jgi:hypothetical protein